MWRLIYLSFLAVALAGTIAWYVREREGAEPSLEARHQMRLEALLPAAKDGDSQAQYGLAIHYHRGLGVGRDPALAVHWYALAAEQGHGEANFALGRMYETGDGIRRNYPKAAELYAVAAVEAGHADAQFALAEIYNRGRGVLNDPGVAFEWYLRAALGGHATARFLLGDIYAKGWGREPDFVEAYAWYSLAVPKAEAVMAYNAKFDPVAARQTLGRKMSRAQITRAERRARAIRASSRQ